jgi:predicted ATPase with chaperone activity
MDTLLKTQEFLNFEPLAGPAQKPRSIAELDVRQTVLEDIALKTLYLSGPFSVFELSSRTGLSFEVANELFGRLREELLCKVTGMTANVSVFAITSQGRTRALELLSQNQYAGVAPVSLASYVKQVRKQSVRNVLVHADNVERAFGHLVIGSKILRQLGTALNSGGAIFLYGPPGVGKTASRG